MRKMFLSFLGLGTYDETKKRSEYKPTIYELGGKKSKKTEFVQVAEIEILGHDAFDTIIIVATQKSYDAHFDNLRGQLLGIDVDKAKSSEVRGRTNGSSGKFEVGPSYVSNISG